MENYITVYIIHWLTNDTWEHFYSESAYYGRLYDVRSWGYLEDIDYRTFSMTEKNEVSEG